MRWWHLYKNCKKKEKHGSIQQIEPCRVRGAPNKYNPNQIFLIGDGFGLFVFFEKFEDTHFRNGVVKRPESKPRGPRKPKLVKDKEDNYENH